MIARRYGFAFAFALACVASSARAEPPLTKGPFFIDVLEDSARVMFETATSQTVSLTLRAVDAANPNDPDSANSLAVDPEAADPHAGNSNAVGEAPNANATNGPEHTATELDGASPQHTATELDGASPQHTATQLDEASPQPPGVFTREGTSLPWRQDGRSLGSIRVSGLSPGTEYRVEITAAGGTSTGTFRTAARSEDDIRFLVYGDNRTQHDEHRRILAPMLRETDVRFLLHTGDMVEMGGRPLDWDIYFDIAGPLLRTTPIFPCLGNHEVYGPGGGLAYLRHLAAPGTREAYYERRHGPLRIFSLDSNDDWAVGSAQLEWLRDRLAEPTDARFTFALAHHSPVSSGPHGGHQAMVASGALEMMRSAGVDLFFAGHDHMYERGDSDGFKYIITGGGGAPLYRQNRELASQLAFMPTYHYLRVDVHDDEVSVSAVDSEGELLERCSFEKGEPWRCADGSPRGPVWEGEPFVEPPPPWRTWAAATFAGAVVLGLAMLWRSRRRRL